MSNTKQFNGIHSFTIKMPRLFSFFHSQQKFSVRMVPRRIILTYSIKVLYLYLSFYSHAIAFQSAFVFFQAQFRRFFILPGKYTCLHFAGHLLKASSASELYYLSLYCPWLGLRPTNKVWMHHTTLP